MSDVPEGWRRVKLKDCGTWWSGGTPATEEPRFWGGEIPWISAASLKNFNIVDSARRVTRAGSMAGTKLVNAGTVLFVVRGMSLKSEFRVGVARRQVAFGQDCKAILPHPAIDATFLGLALKARERDILAMVDEAGHGTGRLPTDLLAKLEVHIPEGLGEQRRIAEILDALDVQIAAEMNELAKRRLLRNAALRRAMAPGLRMIDSVDASRFGEIEGIEEDAWSSVRLGSLLRRIEAGVSPDLEDRPAGHGEWGVLKVSAIGPDGFRPMENKVVLDRLLRQQSLCVAAGDLIMTRANTSELVGLSCVAPEVAPHLMLSDKILRLVVDFQKVSPEYIDLVLGAPEMRKQIEIAATGTSASMKNISQSSIRALMVPFSNSLTMENVCRIDSEMRSALERQQAAVTALRDLKRGLVEDLLTGRVRV